MLIFMGVINEFKKAFSFFDVIVTKIHVVDSGMVEIVRALFYM